MPIMNGYDLTRAIRLREVSEHRPACVVWGFTANAQPEEKQRCRDAGMDDCLFKPISLTSLHERLSKLHRLDGPHQGADQEAKQTASGGPLIEAFNMGSVSVLTGGRSEMVRRLLTQLRQSSQDDRLELATLKSADNRPELAQLAHKIKGAARIIRASTVIEGCERLEDACTGVTEQQDIDHCKQTLEHAMLTLEQALQDALEKMD